jgi:hypothetical protein
MDSRQWALDSDSGQWAVNSGQAVNSGYLTVGTGQWAEEGSVQHRISI